VDNEVEVEANEVVVKISRCPYGLEGTNQELCEAMMTFDIRGVEMGGPNVTMKIVKTVAVGDPQCVLSVRPKKVGYFTIDKETPLNPLFLSRTVVFSKSISSFIVDINH